MTSGPRAFERCHLRIEIVSLGGEGRRGCAGPRLAESLERTQEAGGGKHSGKGWGKLIRALRDRGDGGGLRDADGDAETGGEIECKRPGEKDLRC
jgi:hypothetical protein